MEFFRSSLEELVACEFLEGNHHFFCKNFGRRRLWIFRSRVCPSSKPSISTIGFAEVIGEVIRGGMFFARKMMKMNGMEVDGRFRGMKEDEDEIGWCLCCSSGFILILTPSLFRRPIPSRLFVSSPEGRRASGSTTINLAQKLCVLCFCSTRWNRKPTHPFSEMAYKKQNFLKAQRLQGQLVVNVNFLAYIGSKIHRLRSDTWLLVLVQFWHNLDPKCSGLGKVGQFSDQNPFRNSAHFGTIRYLGKADKIVAWGQLFGTIYD